MRRIRDLLSALAFVVLTAISLWGATLVAKQEFPDPRTLEPIDVRQWLTQRDLAQASAADRSRLIRRLEEQVRSGERMAERNALQPAERQRLQENLLPLLQQWFHDKANAYAQLPADRREEWLDREVGQLEQLVPRGKDQKPSMLKLSQSVYVIGLIGSQMERWIQAADPRTQPRLREFQQALTKRLLSRPHGE